MATRKKKAAVEVEGDSEAFERLRKLIVMGEPPALIEALLAISTDAERKALSQAVYKLHRDAWSGRIPNAGKSLYSNSPLAVLAICDLAQARKVQLHPWGSLGKVSSQVTFLLRRKPAWIASWVQAQLQFREPTLSWELIEAVMDAGVELDMETDEFITHFGNRFNDVHRSLSQRLTARPALLALVPGLFEVPSSAFTLTWSTHRERWPLFETWTETLGKLSQSGQLDRAQLLKLSLAALHRDFSPMQLSSFVNFHSSLKPTEEEKAELVESYIELLGSPSPKVAAFAAKSCLGVKKLDKEAFLRAALPAMRLPTKTVAGIVLKAAQRFATKAPCLLEPAVEIASEALNHASREIAEEARGWLGSLDKKYQPSSDQEPSDAVPEEITLEFDGIDSRWVSLFDLKTSAEIPGPFAYEMHQVPFRMTPVEAIANLSELIDTVAGAVEECRSGDEIERILDGISRLGAERPADFGVRTEALRKRIETIPDSETVKGLVSGWGGISRELKGLLLSWLTGQVVVVPVHNFAKSSRLFPFGQGRLAELSRRVVAGRPAPLLAAPTHLGGWILPQALVERMARVQLEQHRFDLVAALIRLSPHGQKNALQQAVSLPGEEGRAVRWALGDSEGPRRSDRRSELWLAAGRVRKPRAELSAELGFDEPARALQWTAPEGKSLLWTGSQPPAQGSPVKGLVASVKGLFSRVRPAAELDPTSCCYGFMRQAWNEPEAHGAWSLHWRGLVWPANLDSYWRQASLCLGERWDSDGSAVFPNQVYLEPLFDPDRPWDDPARLVLWMALVSKASEVRVAAIDLFIEGISDGRGHPQPLAETLIRLSQGKGLKTNRLAEGLAEVARAGELHRWTVARILSRLLCNPLPHAGHLLLELLLETSDTLEPDLVEALTKGTAGGKAAKLVARLLKLPASGPGPRIRDLILASRLQRARAWSTT